MACARQRIALHRCRLNETMLDADKFEGGLFSVSNQGASGNRRNGKSKRSNAGTRKGNIESLLNKEFRSEFEVHRIVVIPFPTPNEAMFFEDRDDLLGHAVTISDRAGMRLPVPVIRVGSI